MSRQTIKTAVQTAIVNAATGAGSNVDLERTHPWPDTDLPAVNITALGEEIEYTTAIPARTRYHTLTLQLQATAKETTASRADTNLDSLLDEIDAALTSQTLGGTCRDLMMGTLAYDTNTTGNLIIAHATWDLTVIYTSSEP